MFVTFAGVSRIAVGVVSQAAIAAKRALEHDDSASVLVFNAATGAVKDLDLRGTEAEVIARYAPAAAASPRRGRPKLGVVAREVTLLPRHWEWLASQPGGASIALRKLVEAARKHETGGAARTRREAAYRFMSAMAGNLPGFEEASRALFADEIERLEHVSQAWPPDIRDQMFSCLNGGGEALE